MSRSRDERCDSVRDDVVSLGRAQLGMRPSGEDIQDVTIGLMAGCAAWINITCAPDATPEELGSRWGRVITDFIKQARAALASTGVEGGGDG